MSFQTLDGRFAPASNPLALQQQNQAQGFQGAAAPPIDTALLSAGMAGNPVEGAQPNSPVSVGGGGASPAPAAPVAGASAVPGAPPNPTGGDIGHLVNHYLGMIQKMHFGGTPQTTPMNGVLPSSSSVDSRFADEGVLGG